MAKYITLFGATIAVNIAVLPAHINVWRNVGIVLILLAVYKCGEYDMLRFVSQHIATLLKSLGDNFTVRKL